MKSRIPIATAPHVVKVPNHFLLIRSLQLSLAVLVLSLSIYGTVLMTSPITGIILSLVTSLCTIIVAFYTLIVTYGDMPRIYNYWAIIALESFLFVFWILSFAYLSLPVGQAFYFVNGGRIGRYSRYDAGYAADPSIMVFIDLMMVAVVAGVIELSILYFITLMTFSTIVHYHRREGGQCACIDSESGHATTDDDSKTTSEKAQTEPEPLIYPADSISPENTSLDLAIPEPTATEQDVYGHEQRGQEEQHYVEQEHDLMA